MARLRRVLTGSGLGRELGLGPRSAAALFSFGAGRAAVGVHALPRGASVEVGSGVLEIEGISAVG